MPTPRAVRCKKAYTAKCKCGQKFDNYLDAVHHTPDMCTPPRPTEVCWNKECQGTAHYGNLPHGCPPEGKHSSYTERVTEKPLEVVYDGDADNPAIIQGACLEIRVWRGEDFGNPKLDADYIVAAVNLHAKLVAAGLYALQFMEASEEKRAFEALLREAAK